MRWKDLYETDLRDVTGEDIRDLYASTPADLYGLIDGLDGLGIGIGSEYDWSTDTERMKTFFQQFTGKTLTLYRCVQEKPELSALGIHWSLTKETESFGSYFITASVPPEAVDWTGTIARGIHWWDDEQEITLLREAHITVMEIRELQTGEITHGPFQSTV